MSGIVIRNFADAEERVSFDHGHLDLVTASSLAWPGEVFVSAMARELASGAGIDFEDRGSHELKGFAGMRQSFRARPA